MGTLHWDRLTGRNRWFHLARSHYGPGRRCTMHTHDFAELCWLESGSLIEEQVDKRQQMHCGDGLLIKPAHRHAFRGQENGTVLVNLAFPTMVLDELAVRYPDSIYATDCLTVALQLNGHARALLQQQLDYLLHAPDDRLALDTVLLDLASRARQSPSSPFKNLLGWLQQAFSNCNRPPYLTQGPSALAAQTGKSREHIARTCKKHDGRSPTALFQEMRMHYAAECLRTDTNTIAAIAADCGYSNVAHFHRLFHERFGHTPGQYRRQAKITTG